MKKQIIKRFVKYQGVDLIVEGVLYPGTDGTYFQPAEPEEFDIHFVYVSDTNITDLLSEDQMLELESLTLEK